ncbi:uncharacterized protein EHS24_009249 [Apiotrichum porosum]|uniref:Uncharacterized protein n=1 Tax=Apiotrichum porosum TaxID=105984 RepID=A0A427XL21_9TREE|nr:uncharacterized protein EHS24_009249 [Apiotrichum porosum]RSH79599.1 hypothetical protein EHS24_009249 [Apiotrichum porosum]
MIANDMSPQVDVDEILAFTIKLALEAGEMIRVGQARRFACESAVEATKVNTVDLVTEVDKAVEASILKRISSAYPDHKFMGEETYAGEAITDDPTWIGS